MREFFKSLADAWYLSGVEFYTLNMLPLHGPEHVATINRMVNTHKRALLDARREGVHCRDAAMVLANEVFTRVVNHKVEMDRVARQYH